MNPLIMVGAVQGAIAFVNGTGWMNVNVISQAIDVQSSR